MTRQQYGPKGRHNTNIMVPSKTNHKYRKNGDNDDNDDKYDKYDSDGDGDGDGDDDDDELEVVIAITITMTMAMYTGSIVSSFLHPFAGALGANKHESNRWPTIHQPASPVSRTRIFHCSPW